MDVIEVLDGGFFTTVQDLGRYGYQRYGVPVAGALDQFALRSANVLVSNREGDAGLEITLVGPRLRFLADTVIAITGANLDPRLDDAPVAMWQAVAVAQGGTLSFGSVQDGMRAYLAVAGGIDVPQVLGSRSTYTRSRLGGVEGRALAPGDRLAAFGQESASGMEGRKLPREQIPAYGHSHVLRVVLGPQDDAFSQEGLRIFLSAAYTVTPQSDRIGYRHQGPQIHHKEGADIVSDGIPFGAVQVTGDGMPIVLLADRGTTGGYAKIATVISVDLATVAQAGPGDTMSFRQVTVEVAHQALRQQEDAIQQLGNTPPTMFARRRYRATVNGVTHDVVTALEEAVPRPPSPGTEAAPLRKVVRATVDGETHTFKVEVRGFDSL
jgi:biotin-dependent carboxylase-like uncharacterized protein